MAARSRPQFLRVGVKVQGLESLLRATLSGRLRETLEPTTNPSPLLKIPSKPENLKPITARVAYLLSVVILEMSSLLAVCPMVAGGVVVLLGEILLPDAPPRMPLEDDPPNQVLRPIELTTPLMNHQIEGHSAEKDI